MDQDHYRNVNRHIYAQIEEEMLAIVSACKKLYHFKYGRDNIKRNQER